MKIEMPVANAEAVREIERKAPVLAGTFKALLPELRQRAIVVSGVNDLSVVTAVRDAIATLPQGAAWGDVKKDVLGRISPWLVDPDLEGEELQRAEDAAVRRAELLLRTHGYQAYQAGRWRAIQEYKKEIPWLEYRTVGDGKVRDSHAALDGIILPADDPFWKDHFPPWDFGCRCQAIPMAEVDVAQIREAEADLPPERQSVIEGARLEKLRRGTLDLGPSRQVSVSSPVQREGAGAYRFDPGSLALDAERLSEGHEPADFALFEAALKLAGVEL